MPTIKIDKVVSFSSEDPIHTASNILLNDTGKKWKCQNPGEKAANLVLQLEEASVISSLDIGNEHSAYIEVLVNRSGSDDDFKVLLVMSSFMTPLESRQSTNVNKVRMFTHDQLIQPERDEKWDRIKIICTQPFNRHVTYGLSFIKLHTMGKDAVAPQGIQQVGKFNLRPDSPNNISIGSLFARKKELQDDKPLTAAAAIRTASLSPLQSPQNNKKIKLPQTSTTANDVTIPQLSRKRDEILYTKDEDEPNEKIDFVVEQKKKEKEQLENKTSTNTTKQGDSDKTKTNGNNKLKNEKNNDNSRTDSSKNHKNNDNSKPSSSKDKRESFKRKLNESPSKPSKKAKNQLKKPYHQLLDGVVFVISGIENPDRADIRNTALLMGAKYKTNWDNTCTHLICAFSNTPKYHQVKGKGKIVTKKWIFDCDAKRKRLPWRRYAFDKGDQKKPESEDEICEEQGNEEHRDEKSGSDTEDEIERINTLEKLKNGDRKTHDSGIKNSPSAGTSLQNDYVYNCDTDEEMDDPVLNTTASSKLGNCFENKVFYIDKSMNKEDKKTVFRLITANNGTVITSLDISTDFAVAEKNHKLKLPNGCSDAAIVSPNFVYECFNSDELLSTDDFAV